MSGEVVRIHGPEHVPGGPDPIPDLGGAGNAVYAIEVFEADVTVLAGDNRFEWAIPAHLDGAVLTALEGYLTEASSSTTVQVQIANERYGSTSVDMLSTKLSIDVGELDSDDATTPVVIDAGNATVAHKDHLRVDVDTPGVGAKGLGLILTFVPSDTYTMAISGQQGPPGGVTAWSGSWSTATDYDEGQAVANNGTSYVARSDHTSGASSEPGVGASWETFWQVLSESNVTSAIQVLFVAGGFALTPGLKLFVEVPFDCTIYEVVMLGDAAGSAVVDIWRDTYANHPPTNADSITSSSPPTISSATKSVDSVLTGWSTSLNEGDVLAFNVDSCVTITRLTVSVKVRR